MMAFLENPIWLLGLTFVIYYGTIMLNQKIQSPFLNPVLIASAVIIGYLMVFNIPYNTYAVAGNYIDFWLKPSVVALAVPLYLQLERIKKQLIPILISHLFGSIVGILSVCSIAKLLGAKREVIISLAPKSITTPLAIEVSNTVGGIVPLTVSAVIITGLVGGIIGLQVLKYTKINSPMGQSISLGASSHGLGVMMAIEMSEKHAGFASVGLILNGIFTALLAPIIVNWLF
ncbi:LrgB family protein [Riemerella anatipestifer]|uniref:LrgB family protein n=1 Tax=Riemerella anatipestifer TaxID=34085 RepID=UPI0036714860